jgi:diguanylate cyclase (GGDEF)-like protein
MVAFLLLSRRRDWPWLLLGFVVFQVLEDLSETTLIGQITVDTGCDLFEVLFVTLTLPPCKSLGEWLQQPGLIARFTASAAVVAPAMTGILTALYYHFEKQRSFSESALRWAVADSLGMVLWVPLVLVLCSRETYALFGRKKLPATIGFLSLVFGISWLVFHQSNYPVAFVMMPLLLLVALRMGFSGSVLAVNILTVIATSSTLGGTGQFATIRAGDQTQQVLLLQAFLVLAMLTSFPISLVMLEREGYAQKLQAAYQRMELLATQDALTGLSNRRHFDVVLDQEWRRARRECAPLAVLMADVDSFKSYNDRYGHVAGDRILTTIAEVIRSVPKRPGDLVARYGGEEFVILLPGTDSAQAKFVADSIRHRIYSLNFDHGDSSFKRVTISLGCASIVPRDSLQPSMLIKGSDEALYDAKRSGRNRVEIFLFPEIAPVGDPES